MTARPTPPVPAGTRTCTAAGSDKHVLCNGSLLNKMQAAAHLHKARWQHQVQRIMLSLTVAPARMLPPCWKAANAVMYAVGVVAAAS